MQERPVFETADDIQRGHASHTYTRIAYYILLRLRRSRFSVACFFFKCDKPGFFCFNLLRMAHNSLLGFFESLWHYGLPPSPALHFTSSIATAPVPHLSRPAAVSFDPGSLVRSLFSVMDEDGDGRLSLCEMRSLLAKLHISSQSTHLQSFIQQNITSSTQSMDDAVSLDFPQFAQLHASLFGASHEIYCSTQGPLPQRFENDDCFEDELLDAFRVYDTNRDGFISAAELAAVLLELGLLPDGGCRIDAHLGRCQAYIDSVDLDGDGMVDLDEFKCMMTHNQSQALQSK